MKKIYILFVIAAFSGLCYSAVPVIIHIYVPQDSVTVYEDSCKGIIELGIEDSDGDSLIVGIQISSDSGETWHVPFLSDFFIKRASGQYEVPFTVSGQHGDKCIAKVTVYDELPVSDKMRLIPSGNHLFLMGSSDGENDEKPVHPVAFTYNFWMDTVEISADEFIIFMSDYVHEYAERYWYEDNCPIDNCMWHWAVQYCNWRSKNEGFDTCYANFPEESDYYKDFLDVTSDISKNGYRLPTEAEWEYACRAGAMTPYFWGDDTTYMVDYCWYRANFNDTIHAVGKKLPNKFGLYDMFGSFLEICNDWYEETYYEKSEFLDPTGPETFPQNELAHDPYRVTRGGFFISPSIHISSSYRMPNFSSARHPQIFRCVRTNLQ